MLEYGCLKIRLFAGSDGRHFVDILGSLFRQNPDGVIKGYDPYDKSFLIQYRYCDQSISAEEFGCIFPVVSGSDKDKILFHQIFHLYILIIGHQCLCRNNANQLPLHDHIASIHRLAVDSDGTDLMQGLPYRHVRGQIHILYRHNASRAILRVIQKPVDIRTRILAHLIQQLIDYIGRHIFQQIHRVVRIHGIQDVLDLLAGKAVKKRLPLVIIHIRKYFCCLILLNHPEYDCQIPVV